MKAQSISYQVRIETDKTPEELREALQRASRAYKEELRKAGIKVIESWTDL